MKIAILAIATLASLVPNAFAACPNLCTSHGSCGFNGECNFAEGGISQLNVYVLLGSFVFFAF